jgi:hypothetical protein
VHRISQKNSVNIYYMYGPNTLDDRIFTMLASKSEVIRETMDGLNPELRQQQIGDDVYNKEKAVPKPELVRPQGIQIHNLSGGSNKVTTRNNQIWSVSEHLSQESTASKVLETEYKVVEEVSGLATQDFPSEIWSPVAEVELRPETMKKQESEIRNPEEVQEEKEI